MTPTFELDRDDLRIFLLYGRTMFGAQMLEFSVFELAQLERPSKKDLDRDLRRIEGLLKQPRRDQAKNLATLPDELREEILEALALRNRLAHDFLVEYRMAKIGGDAAAWAGELLRAATVTFDELYEALDAHSKKQLAAAGIDVSLTSEEEEGIVESLQGWLEDASSPEDTDDG